MCTIEYVGLFQQLFLILTRIANGWIQSFTIIPYLLLTNTFSIYRADDKCKIHLWYGISSIGDGIGLLVTQVMLEKMTWNFAFLIFVAFSWLLALAQYLIIEEVHV